MVSIKPSFGGVGYLLEVDLNSVTVRTAGRDLKVSFQPGCRQAPNLTLEPLLWHPHTIALSTYVG